MANFSIKARLNSITDALTGIGHLIRGEHNAWIHLVDGVDRTGIGYQYRLVGGRYEYGP